MRRRMRCGFWFLGLIALVGCQEPGENLNERPNILVILIDDLRPDLGSYGHSTVVSPAIDRLAELGVRFDRAYAQSPVCSPSRASLLTGLRPETTGVFDNRDSLAKSLPAAVTLPNSFRAGGYFTAGVGKIFHGAGRRGAWTDQESWDLEIPPAGIGPSDRRANLIREQGQVGRYGWRSYGGPDKIFPDVRTTQRAIAVLDTATGQERSVLA